MAAGELYKSLLKNQNLQPLVDNIREYVRKKRQEENLAKLMQLIQGTQRGIKDIYEPPPQKSSQPSLSTEQMQESRTPIFNPRKVTTGQLVNPTQQQDTTTVTDNKLPEQPTLFSKNKEANLRMLGFLKELMSLQEVEPEKLQTGLSIVQGTKEAYQPPAPQFFDLSPGERRMKYNTETGKSEEVAYNPKDQTGTSKYMWHTIGTGTKDGKKYATQEHIITGERRTVELGEKEDTGTNVNIELPEVNIDNNIAKLTEYTDAYDYFDKIDKDVNAPEESKTDAKTQKAVYLSKIKGVTDALGSQLNDKIPKFEGTLNFLYQKVGNDPSKIDEAVEKELKGHSPDTIRWMKKILHARVF